MKKKKDERIPEKQRMEASLVELEPLRMVPEEEEGVNVRGRVGQWRSVEWVLVDVVLVTELTGNDDAIAAVVSKPSTEDIIPSSSTSPNSREEERATKCLRFCLFYTWRSN